ncbi:MAG TPA: hypothetical protein VIF09_13760 [Polyangiaceae bacterium]|jgi:hypothetical protein
MARNSALVWVRIGVVLASWAAAVSVVQSVGAEGIEGPRRELEERIEHQLRGVTAPPQAQPERSHEDESLEPWELVSV